MNDVIKQWARLGILYLLAASLVYTGFSMIVDTGIRDWSLDVVGQLLNRFLGLAIRVPDATNSTLLWFVGTLLIIGGVSIGVFETRRQRRVVITPCRAGNLVYLGGDDVKVDARFRVGVRFNIQIGSLAAIDVLKVQALYYRHNGEPCCPFEVQKEDIEAEGTRRRKWLMPQAAPQEGRTHRRLHGGNYTLSVELTLKGPLGTAPADCDQGYLRLQLEWKYVDRSKTNIWVGSYKYKGDGTLTAAKEIPRLSES